MYQYYDKRVYELKEHDAGDYSEALKKIREWNYHKDSNIALGVFYKKEAATFEEKMSISKKDPVEINANIEKILANSV